MKKERLGLWFFWVILLVLIVPWLRIGARIQTNLREEMAKPFLPTEEFDRAVSQCQMIMKEDEKKLKAGAYSPKDFHQAIYTLFRLESGLCERFNVPADRKGVLESWRTNYGNTFFKQLYDKIIEEKQLPGFVMEKARQEVWQENGIKGALEGKITFTHFVKLLKWLFLFAWPISSVLAFFFFVYRCQIRGFSFKEIFLTSPFQVMGYSIFWLAGLAVNYPEGNLGATRRYFRLKAQYMRGREWGYKLSQQEEQILWQRAYAPVNKFNRSVEQTLAYSRVMAFISSLFIWLFVTPFTNLRGQDKVTVQVNPDTANLWYFHAPEKGLNFYFMRVWPSGYLLTKFGPPEIRISKKVSVSLGMGPDLNVKAAKFKDFIESFTLDVVPAIFTGKFGMVLVNELGIDKDRRPIFFFRHSVGYSQIGLMWSSFGRFGERVPLFRLGPTVKLGKVQFWAADDLKTGKWLVEASFSVKL